MERYAGNHCKDQYLFFVLGASDELIENLKKIAIRVSMRLSSSVEYLVKLPIREFMGIVEEIIKIDRERRNKE